MSLFENNGEQEITVYILGEELSNDSMKKFNEIGRTYKKNIVIGILLVLLIYNYNYSIIKYLGEENFWIF